MADKQLSALTAASALAAADLLYVSQGGNSRKATAAQVKTYVDTYRGALVYKNVAQTAANFTTAANVSFTTEDHDTDGFWDAGSPTIFTIPSGVSRVRLSAGISIVNVTADLYASASITKGGADFVGSARTRIQNSSTTERVNLSTAVVSVSAGNTFAVNLLVITDTSIDLDATSTWFSIEVVE